MSNIIVVPSLDDDLGAPICDGRATPPTGNVCMPWPSKIDDLGLTVIIQTILRKCFAKRANKNNST